MKVIHTPGHTKGSCCYFLEEQKVLFSGDTLFMESVGRADLPTGNEKDLMQSVREINPAERNQSVFRTWPVDKY